VYSVGNYSPEEVQGKIVHLLSCETAGKLGPDLVSHGCRAFFVTTKIFRFNSFQMDIADIFFQCDSEIDRAFADGLTAADVYSRVVALFDKNIAALRAQGSDYKRNHGIRSGSSPGTVVRTAVGGPQRKGWLETAGGMCFASRPSAH
jgi:hypothetical protein